MERFTPKEALKLAVVGLVAIGVTACGGAMAVNENYVWYSDEFAAVDPVIVKHEACHQEQIRAMGGADKFWNKYLTDQQFACESELSCNADESHFACNGIK